MLEDIADEAAHLRIREHTFLTVRLLGPPTIWWRSTTQLAPRRLGRALLYRLAAQMQPVSRDELLCLFWPEEPDESARRKLSSLLSALRRCLPDPSLLLATSSSLSLSADHCWSDSATFYHLLETSPAQAVEIVTGSFLAGFTLPHHAEWEAWRRSEGAYLERKYLAALWELVDEAITGGNYRIALDYAHRYLAQDPLSEAMLRRLMVLHTLLDERHMALRLFEQGIAMLERDLQLAPLPETRVVFEAIRENWPGADLLALLHQGTQPPLLPVQGGSMSRQSLPAQANRFIGRTCEVAQVQHLLTSARLVTITGPCGVGKSRLALEVCQRLATRYSDGILHVDLAPLNSLALVLDTIASALGIDSNDKNALPQLLTILRDRHTLLLLDNCEHLAELCAGLTSELLQSCPRLRILATSRRPHRVKGESVCALPPLALPCDMECYTHIAASEATSLFVDRASAVLPGFQLTEQNAGTVAEICCRLEGLPLAIEIAASRAWMMSLPEIARRLEDRFALLVASTSERLQEAGEEVDVRRAYRHDILSLTHLFEQRAADSPSPQHASLSKRERAVLRLVAEGLSDAEVAARLILSPRTIQNHLTRIYHKFDVHNRTAAVDLARKTGQI
jgi:DNA-binding SARP family transcriptional activator/DNA-binding CsgD family transcriptional regulator